MAQWLRLPYQSSVPSANAGQLTSPATLAKGRGGVAGLGGFLRGQTHKHTQNEIRQSTVVLTFNLSTGDTEVRQTCEFKASLVHIGSLRGRAGLHNQNLSKYIYRERETGSRGRLEMA